MTSAVSTSQFLPPAGFSYLRGDAGTEYFVPTSSLAAVTEVYAPSLFVGTRAGFTADDFSYFTSDEGPDYLIPNFMAPAFELGLTSDLFRVHLNVAGAEAGVSRFLNHKCSPFNPRNSRGRGRRNHL
jgi:hypothetical protein